MMDLDKIAEIFAGGSYEIANVQRLVIQPKSILRGFKTVQYGFLFIVRGEAKMHVNGTAYDLLPGTVVHAAPGMQMDSRVIGQSELEYFIVFYRWNKHANDTAAVELDTHFKLESGANPRLLEALIMIQQKPALQAGSGSCMSKSCF